MSGQAPDTDGEAGEFWLFGYGSLIWKPPPHFDRRIPGWVTGYVRRFWQASQDHRGTPEAPGRVVTLISRSYWEQLTDHHDSAPDKVWGVAYRIKADRVAEVREYLDIREINGYTIHYTPFHPAPPATHTTSTSKTATDADAGADADLTTLPDYPIRTLVYIGTPDNDQFVGPQDPQLLAEHIFRSSGPSGQNRDYLLGLEAALDELSPESGDEHVTDLSNRLRAVIAREEGAEKGGDGREQQHHEQPHDFKKVSSIDEQEETEKSS
ncbi:ChaC-like protein-domain-containing protein [Dichotomopilus funicola]|uniref:glutathione-specific gamma-glutamylcyclotransferase n=1 Tax=Dichotomopilus funicola TaxID=1934379 RepID=A0AAN6V4E3_9PEZI|nr:ChaC-like protein-domain-containing protein [Dichotomopilus funicola]